MSQNDLAWEATRTDLREASRKLQQAGYPVEYSEDDDTITIRINHQPEKSKRKRKTK